MRNRVVLAVAFLFLLVPGILLALAPARDENEDPKGTTGALKEQIQTGGSYSAYSGNATRVVTDLSVPDALGENGLNFTRYWNSTHNNYEDEDADWPTDFGFSGWSHSWKWTANYKGETIEEENGPAPQVHNMAITITFPDGHTAKYKIVRYSAELGGHPPDDRVGPYYTDSEINTSWPEGGMGVHDHLTKMAVWGEDFWLSLADGGAVHFVRITPQNALDGEYRATEVFDRHGLKTVLEYNNQTGELEKVRQDDGGRFLKITWSTINSGPFSWRVITKVETGGTGLQQVIYSYTLSWPHLVLANVAYENDPAPGQTTYATYTYGSCYGAEPCSSPEVAEFPMLKRADDPRYAGAMTKIHYNYWGGVCPRPEPTPPWQPPLYVPAQPYAIAAEVSNTGWAVSRFQLYCDTGERVETNGFNATRMFYFGSAAGTGQAGFLCRGFQLGKVTDFFKPNSPPAILPDHRQNFYFGHPRQIWDGRGNETQSFYLDSSGSPSEVRHIEDGSSVIYDRLDDSLSETPLHSSMHNSNMRWLFKKRDELGRFTYYKRDSRRRVKEIAYPDNWHEFFTYNNFNQVETHRLPSDAEQHYHYNALQQLEWEENSVDGPDARKEYSHDSLGRVLTMRDGRARREGAPFTVRMTYNGRHQVLSVEYAAPSPPYPTVFYEYDKYGNCTAITNELGHRSTYTYDAYRRCTSYVEPLNAPGWNGSGIMSARRWDWIYDRLINGTLYPASSHTSKEWRIQVEPAFNGAGLRRMTAREHDVNNRIVLEQTGWIQPPGKIGAGNAWYPGPDIETHRTTYDENGQKSSFTDTLGRITDYIYNNRNRLEKTIEKPIPSDPSAPRTTETHYDPAGNKLWVKFPDNQTQQWQNYDAFGQAQLFISERNHPTDLIYCWGPMKKLYQVITHRDGEQGQLTEFGYDLMGRPTKILFPDGTYEETQYELGQVKSWRNRRGGTKVIDQYDARGRETHHYWLLPPQPPSNEPEVDLETPAITRVWDAANRLTSISNVYSAIDYGYDDAGQVKWEGSSINGAGGRVEIKYYRYADGEVSQMVYPNLTGVERFYTERGQLLSVGWGGGMSTAFDYRSDGRVTYQARTNGVGTNYGYDGRGIIKWLSHRRGATQTTGEHDLARRDYWRDDRDRILAWKRGTDNYYNGMEDGRGTRYGYDPEGQLTTASYRMPNPEATPGPSPNGAVRMDSFVYDELGSRKNDNHIASRGQWMRMERRNNGLNQYHTWSNDPEHPAPDPAHWGSPIYHDDEFGFPGVPPGNGDVTADGYLTAKYNALNQPVGMWSKVYIGTTNYMWFGYDPLGRCVKRWKGPPAAGIPGYQYATYFYYDGWNLIQEGPSAGGTERTYVHGGRIDEIVASQVGGVWYNHHYDAQGNCILLSTTNGDIAEQYDYDAFGYPYFYNAGGGKGTGKTRFLFTGREWISDMRIYDYRVRMYQPELGRFLQPDPKHFGAGDYNLYRYCHNDPVNMADPTGLWSQWQNQMLWQGGGDGSVGEQLLASDQRRQFLSFTPEQRLKIASDWLEKNHKQLDLPDPSGKPAKLERLEPHQASYYHPMRGIKIDPYKSAAKSVSGMVRQYAHELLHYKDGAWLWFYRSFFPNEQRHREIISRADEISGQFSRETGSQYIEYVP